MSRRSGFAAGSGAQANDFQGPDAAWRSRSPGRTDDPRDPESPFPCNGAGLETLWRGHLARPLPTRRAQGDRGFESLSSTGESGTNSISLDHGRRREGSQIAALKDLTERAAPARTTAPPARSRGPQPQKVCLKNGFDTDHIYELIYTAKTRSWWARAGGASGMSQRF